MEKVIKIIFPELNETVSVELDDSQSPKTVKAILENLPIEVNINKWGEELYTDKTSIVAQE
ncbi:MAG TPA: cyclophilin-like family protein, partial [Nitrososphaeraceae archaeon]|nr:cyclophilin-like family protein [Nitrososphaeraceae archaeon]